MEYEEIIDTDPYAGYDPAADPYQADDLAGTGDPGSFEFYDEGMDPSSEDELYFSDTELPGEFDYDEYEEFYDGPILEGEEDMMYTDDWLPLPTDAIPLESIPLDERPADYDTELYIGGLQYPDPGEVRDSYCELYPEACAEGQLGLNGREVYNGTEVAEEMSRTLKDVDFTGVCIAALLLLVLLFGLHYGGDSQTPAEAAATPPRVESKDDERKKYDGFLKEAGYPDDEKRKKKLDEIMALPDKKERAKKVDEAVTKFYDSELKKAGYKDDTERGTKVKGILAQKTPEERTKKLEDYVKRMATPAGTTPDPSSVAGPSSSEIREVSKKLKDAGIKDEDKSIATRIAKMPKDEQDAEIQRLKAAQPTPSSNGGDPAASGPSATAIERMKKKLKDQGIKDDDKDTEAKRIAALPREQQNDEIGKLKAAQAAAAGGGAGGGEPSAAAIESVKKRLKAAGIKDDDKDTEAKRIANLPKREDQDAEIKKLKEKKEADANETERAAYEGRLKTYGYDDAESKKLSAEVMKEPTKEKRKEKMEELKQKGPKAKGAASGADPKAAQAEKDEKERAEYEAKLKTYGYDDAKSKALSAEVMKEPTKEKRREKMTELRKNRPKDAATADPEATSNGGKGKSDTAQPAEALTDDAITKQLNAKGYTEPEVQKKRLADIRAKGDPKAQQKELERLLAKPEAVIKKENDEARKKREGGAAVPAGTVPPAADAGAVAPTGTTDGKTPSKTPKNADELKARLKELGYKDPVIEQMVKAWEDEKDDKRKQSMLRGMFKPENKAKYEDRYKEGSAVVPPVAGVVDPPTGDDGKGKGIVRKPPGDEEVKKYLKERMKYSDPAIENMMKEYRGKSDEEKQKLLEKLKDREKRVANEKEYNPTAAPVADGVTPPVVDAADPNAGKQVKPKYKTAKDFEKALKNCKYSTAARAAMLKAWEDEKDVPKRAELETKLITNDPTKRAANEAEYGKKGDEPPVSDASKPKLAGMTEDKLRELLKSKGYDDKDAQDEIMDKLRKIPDEKGQIEVLSKDYLRSPGTIKKKNEQLGNERRARAAGEDPSKAGGDPAGAEVDVPNDDELDKRLKEAGWTDEKARKQAIEKIRGKEKPEDRLKEMKKHLRPGAATPETMASYATAWDNKGKSIVAMTPEDEARINKELETAGITDPLARKNMINELKDKTEPKDRDAKYQSWLKRDKEKMKDLNKRRGDTQRKIEEGGATNPDGTPRKKGAKAGEEDTPTKPAYPYWILGFLLIPLLFVLAKRGKVTMPTGRYPLSMPSLPPMGGPWATGSSWGPWGAREVEVTTGPKINRGLPEFPRKKTTKSVSSPRLSPRSGSSAPSININNVNAQGENIPIDITSGSGGSGEPIFDTVVEETVITEVTEEIPAVVTQTVVVEETVVIPEGVAEEHIVAIEEEPVGSFEFQGPSDPDRLMWMLISAGIISIPLLLDMTAGWPLRQSANIEYLSEAIHWLVLVSAAATVYLKLDQTYHWSSRYGRRVPRYVTPVVVGAARGTENLVWSIDDAMFGGDQQMLGIAVVGGAFALMMMWNPFSNAESGEPTDGGGQMAGLVAMGMIAFLMANA